MNWFVHHGFDVWNLELRGHGLSRANGAPYPEAFEDYTEKDVPATLNYVLQTTGREKLVYCGHSLGGCIAYALADESKAHFHALVTICSPFDFRHAIDRMKLLGRSVSWLVRSTPLERLIPRYFAMDAIGRLIRNNLWYFDSHANRLPCQIWVPGSVEREVLDDLLKFSFDRTSNEVIRFMLEWLTSGEFENKVRGIDYRQRMDSIACPTLIVAASKDELAPPNSVAAAFEHVGSPQKRLHILSPDNTGFHWGHYDVLCGRTAPRQVWPVITDWLDETLLKESVL
jgi:pimeloyl-ACP methyl ester carboxylesterase